VSKDRKKQREELLGMSTSTAEKKLRKSIILDLARQLGKNVCLECGLVIDDPDDLAIKHVEDWGEDPAQYFDLTNVAFGHVSCGAGDHGRTQEAESKMRRVEVTVEDQKGVPLRGCVHQGQVYVAGEKDQRYQVRVRNSTGRRLLVVVTVDGRNVNSGKKGDWNDSGHVLEPHAQWVFTGWRQSDDKVAAFRLGQKDDAYSSQMGSPENVGVIGVAVFEEKQPERQVITIREKEYVPMPYPVYPTWPRPVRPWSPFDPYAPVWITTPTITIGGTSQTAGGFFSSQSGVGTSGTSCSVASVNSSLELDSSSIAPETAPRSRSSRQRVHHQELGTEYGESISSAVVKANFVRATDAPVEVFIIRYDSLEVLVRAGIMGRRPSQKRRDAPRAFPESPDVGRGYCEPPPRQRAYKG
jgi:hypothetical protein